MQLAEGHLKKAGVRNYGIFDLAVDCRERGLSEQHLLDAADDLVKLAMEMIPLPVDPPYTRQEAVDSIRSAYRGRAEVVEHVQRIRRVAYRDLPRTKSEWRILEAITTKMLQVGSLAVAYSTRDLADDAGMTNRPAINAVRKLKAAGWLVGTQPSRRQATVWTITPEAAESRLESGDAGPSAAKYTTQQEEESEEARDRNSPSLLSGVLHGASGRVAEDAARRGALGNTGLALWALLTADPARTWTVAELAAELRCRPATVLRHLHRMEDADDADDKLAVRRTRTTWQVATADPDEQHRRLENFAIQHGTHGKGAIQRQRHEEEQIANRIAGDSPELLQPLIDNPFVPDRQRRAFGHQLGTLKASGRHL